MKNKKKDKIEEIVAIILLISFIIALIIFNMHQNNNKYMQIGSLNISSNNFNTLLNAVPEGEFAICSLEDNSCVPFIKKSLDGN